MQPPGALGGTSWSVVGNVGVTLVEGVVVVVVVLLIDFVPPPQPTANTTMATPPNSVIAVLA